MSNVNAKTFIHKPFMISFVYHFRVIIPFGMNICIRLVLLTPSGAVGGSAGTLLPYSRGGVPKENGCFL